MADGERKTPFFQINGAISGSEFEIEEPEFVANWPMLIADGDKVRVSLSYTKGDKGVVLEASIGSGKVSLTLDADSFEILHKNVSMTHELLELVEKPA